MASDISKWSGDFVSNFWKRIRFEFQKPDGSDIEVIPFVLGTRGLIVRENNNAMSGSIGK